MKTSIATSLVLFLVLILNDDAIVAARITRGATSADRRYSGIRVRGQRGLQQMDNKNDKENKEDDLNPTQEPTQEGQDDLTAAAEGQDDLNSTVEEQDDKEDEKEDDKEDNKENDKEDDKNNDKDDNKEDDNEEGADTVPVTEYHTCEPDPQVAIDYVKSFGHPDQGDLDCFADPVNSCPGGCCRFAGWFVCDTEDTAPHMPCVCNQNTAVVEPPAISDPIANVTLPEVGNFTQTESTATEEDDFGDDNDTEDILVDEDDVVGFEAVERNGNPDFKPFG